jgi:hypothetical protein
VDDPKKRHGKTAVLEEDGEQMDMQEQITSLQATVNALLQQAQQKSSGLDEDKLEAILVRVAKISADAQERAANPSNKQHPHISVFSRPKGDIADPRNELKCEMFWVGYPISKDTTTDEEINLLNEAEPGDYAFTRTDGSQEKLTVLGDRDASGKLRRVMFQFVTNERRDSLPSMASMIREAFKIKTAEQLELEALRAEVERLKTHAA